MMLVSSDNEDIIYQALGAKKDNTWMSGVMSRKKQVVPPLQAAFKA